MLTADRQSNPVRERRLHLRITRQELADAARVSPQRITQIEHGDSCGLSTALLIAQKLNTRVEKLFGHFASEEAANV